MIDINRSTLHAMDMVRRIFLVLENEKYERLLKIKDNKTWEELLVDDLLEREEKKAEVKARR